jgi:hypothetical protein
MNDTKITVSGILKGAPDKVLTLLAAFYWYDKWWKATRVKHIDRDAKEFSFYPLLLVRIVLRQISVSGNTVEYQYVKGPFRGTGCWRVEPIGNNLFRLSYTVILQPAGRWSRIILGTAAFRKKHSRDIQKILRELEAAIGGNIISFGS